LSDFLIAAGEILKVALLTVVLELRGVIATTPTAAGA